MIVQLHFQSEVDSSHDDESRGDFLSGKRESSIDSLMTVPDDLHWSDGGKSLGPSGLVKMIQIRTRLDTTEARGILSDDQTLCRC